MNTRTKIAAGGLMIAALAAVSAPAIAADSSTTTPAKGARVAHVERGHRQGASDTATATAIGRPAHIGGHLAALVTAGTITQSQADAFETAEHAAMDAAKAAATTGAQPDHAAVVKSVLAKLVTAGTITQAQSDAINALEAAAPVRAADDSNGDKHGRGHGPKSGAAPSAGTTGGALTALPSTTN